MKLKTTEKGFTLVEVLVAVTILGLVVGAASMTVITMMRLSPKSNEWNIALRQVQNAGYWISRDVQMSRTITVGTGTPTFLTLKLPQDQYPANDKSIVYEFQPMSGDLKRLMRNDQTAGQQTMVAQYIYYNPSDPDNSTKVIPLQNQKLTVTIAATSGNTKVKRQYEAMQRVPP